MKTICDSVNHIRFPKEYHLPNWERRDNKVTKADRVEQIPRNRQIYRIAYIHLDLKK